MKSFSSGLIVSKTAAAILCGGEGTRLRPLTNYFQKTMIPIGTERKPLLEYIVRLIAHHGVKNIALLTGYRSEQIEGYFRDGHRFGAKITYSRDPAGRTGSANALINAIDTGKIGEFDSLVLYYGDVLSTLDVGELLRVHEDEKAAATLVLSKEYVLPVGIAQVVGNRVVSFEEKPKTEFKVTTGSMVISRRCLPALKQVTSQNTSCDIMTHFIPVVLKKKMRVVPFYLRGFWYDVGTTEAYEKLDKLVVDKTFGFLN